MHHKNLQSIAKCIDDVGDNMIVLETGDRSWATLIKRMKTLGESLKALAAELNKDE